MFPYPSGEGLHVGHPEGYTATDITARYKRMKGFNVLHPMGWDAFGLPAEQHAMKTGEHPRENTAKNVANFKRQLNSIGFNYDWDREVNTTDPGYFRWTQWIFRLLYNSWFNPVTNKAKQISTYTGTDPDSVRLAFVSEAPVNWCPGLGTVLANEEVIDGRSKIGDFPVERRPMRQWMLRITAFAERLIDELDGLDWPDSIKKLQSDWIGRSEGAHVTFILENFENRPTSLIALALDTDKADHPDRRRRAGRPPRSSYGGADRVYHAPGHALWRDVHGPRARASVGGRVCRGGAQGRHRRLPRRGQPQVRPGTYRTGEGKNRRVHRRVRRQPGQRRADSRVDCGLRAFRLRHGGHHGRARARRARLGVCEKVRPAHSPGREHRTHRRRHGRRMFARRARAQPSILTVPSCRSTACPPSRPSKP